jgi:hypothetical protein
MIFDNYIADILLKNNASIKIVKNILRLLYILSAFILYFLVFVKLNNSLGGIIIFLMVSVLFDIIRSKNLARFLKNRNLPQ